MNIDNLIYGRWQKNMQRPDTDLIPRVSILVNLNLTFSNEPLEVDE
jgi:hypothetical protein